MSDGEDRDPHEEAAKRGCVVVVPKPHELFIDLDDEASFAVFQATLEILNRCQPEDEEWTYTVTPSPSGEPHHFHVVVATDLTITDERVRLGLQAILGSDRTREALCWNRAACGDDVVTCFFEREEQEPLRAVARPVDPPSEAIASPAPAPEPRPPIDFYWVDFTDRESGTVQAPTPAKALEVAKAFGNPKTARVLPYPATPKLSVQSTCPAFCFAPRECVGKTACPQPYACSE